MPEAKAVVCFWPNNFFFVIGIGWLFLCLNFFMSMFLSLKLRTKLRSLEANGGELCQVIGIKILVLHADSVNGLRLDLRPFEPV